MDRRNAAATLVGLAVAGLVLFALSAFVGIEEMVDALNRARPALVVLVGTAIVAWLCLWGGALHSIAGAVGADVSPAEAVLVHAGAAFANHVTPFGQAGGEPVAAWLLSDVSGANVERALAAVTGFDTVNLLPSLSFAVVGLAYYATVTTFDGSLRVVALGVPTLVLVVATLGSIAWRYGSEVEAGLTRIAVPLFRVIGRVLPRVERPAESVIEGRITGFFGGLERVASDRRRLAVAIGFSAAGWAVQALGLWLALSALGSTVPAHVPLFVVPMGTIASALPTPGGLGGIEAVQVALLTAATDVPAPTVTAAVMIFSVGGFFLTTSLGAAAMAALRARERNASPS